MNKTLLCMILIFSAYSINSAADSEINRNKHGDTPLHIAVIKGDFAGAKSLIDGGAGVNLMNDGASRPLHLAADKGHTDIAALLIKRGADVNAQDKWNRTPLHLAAKNGHKELVQLLIRSGADVNAPDLKNRTPLYLIARKVKLNSGHIESARYLIRSGADINSGIKIGQDGSAYLGYKWEEGKTVLHWACLNGHTEIASMLINNGAKLNVKDIKGETPLHFAAYKGYKEIVKLLLAGNAEVNARDNLKDTPLILAIKTSFPAIGQKWGRRTFIRMSGGRDLYFASLDPDRSRIEIAKLLILKNLTLTRPAEAE